MKPYPKPGGSRSLPVTTDGPTPFTRQCPFSHFTNFSLSSKTLPCAVAPQTLRLPGTLPRKTLRHFYSGTPIFWHPLLASWPTGFRAAPLAQRDANPAFSSFTSRNWEIFTTDYCLCFENCPPWHRNLLPPFSSPRVLFTPPVLLSANYPTQPLFSPSPYLPDPPGQN